MLKDWYLFLSLLKCWSLLLYISYRGGSKSTLISASKRHSNLSIYEWKPKDTSTNLYLLRSSHWRFYVRKGALSIFAKFIFELKHKCIWTRNDGHYEMKKLIVTCNLPVLSAVGLNPTFIIWFRIFEQFSIWSNY